MVKICMHFKLLLVSFLLFTLCVGTADANGVTGTWEYHGPTESGMWLMTLQTGNEVRFQLEISRGAPSYNTGWIEGKFRLKGTSGIFRSSEYDKCAIKFEFKESTVRLQEMSQEEQECGFGYNVHAQGTLVIKSRKKPKFSSGDPRSGRE
jgi:hypothetical protein